jgi:hypothetical protein
MRALFLTPLITASARWWTIASSAGSKSSGLRTGAVTRAKFEGRDIAFERRYGGGTVRSILTIETGAKRLELLAMGVLKAKRVGVVWDPGFQPAMPEFKEIEETARAFIGQPVIITAL